MNLAIDIGNTTVKAALFEGDEMKEVFPTWQSLQANLNKFNLSKAIISKTGSNTEAEAYLQQKNIPFQLLNAALKLPISILYESPATLGADRIAGSVAACRLFPKNNILKIDFGTCITYDFINEKGQYLGGAISPGMQMRFKALNHYTAGLPLVEPAVTDIELTGANTTGSILSGVINGIKAETEGIINEYSHRFDNLKVVATGGDMPFFGALLKSEIFARPYLVLEGLNHILNYNV